ncbi:MAG: dUTP diphosphatase [Tenericutes bacterium]|nr:dUTP diphosphatase [Mycoplasmatota bacterium]
MRKFEKISFEQFKKDISDDEKLYESYSLPKRSTKNSAGYDIASLEEYTLKPGEAHIFVTGLKVTMNSDEVLYLYGRSSFGYKYNITLANSVGVIDSDFYNNIDNEGHFKVKLINHGEKEVKINIGDRIAQGVFMKYLIVDNEEKIIKERKGGLGSTDKEEK